MTISVFSKLGSNERSKKINSDLRQVAMGCGASNQVAADGDEVPNTDADANGDADAEAEVVDAVEVSELDVDGSMIGRILYLKHL